MPYRRGWSRWSKEEDTLLLQKSANQGHFDPERSSEACRTRASLLQVPYRRGGSRWSKEEDALLIQKTANQGHFDWIEISKLFPERSSDACRNRASLLEEKGAAGVKRKHFDWSEISKLFPERSSEACRTHYYGGVNKNVSQRAESESSIRSAIPRVNVPRLN